MVLAGQHLAGGHRAFGLQAEARELRAAQVLDRVAVAVRDAVQGGLHLEALDVDARRVVAVVGDDLRLPGVVHHPVGVLLGARVDVHLHGEEEGALQLGVLDPVELRVDVLEAARANIAVSLASRRTEPCDPTRATAWRYMSNRWDRFMVRSRLGSEVQVDGGGNAGRARSPETRALEQHAVVGVGGVAHLARDLIARRDEADEHRVAVGIPPSPRSRRRGPDARTAPGTQRGRPRARASRRRAPRRGRSGR